MLSSPSGGGKTTIIKELRKKDVNLEYSVSVTTREPRKDEKEGVDYYFLDRETFLKKIEDKAFAEWAEVHGEYYGTLVSQIDQDTSMGKKILLDTDVQGGLNLKKTRTNALLIFLLPPSMNVLKARLMKRGTETEEEIKSRLDTAKEEMKMADEYDFVVINDDLEITVKEIGAIIQRY